MLIFDRKSGKDSIVSEPTTEDIIQKHQKNLEFSFVNTDEMFGVTFSYKIVKVGSFFKKLFVTTSEYAGVVSVQWQPTKGGYDCYLLDVLFGDGNGERVFNKLV